MAEKQCNKCGVIKNTSEFHKAKHGTFGVKGTCKECHARRYSKASGYVSPQSVRNAQEIAQRPPRECPVCVSEFKDYDGRKYCSNICKDEARRAAPGFRERQNQLQRERYKNNPKSKAKALARTARRSDSIRNDPVKLERARKWRKEHKRKLRRKAGRPTRKEMHLASIARRSELLAKGNAAQAWQYWLKVKAPDRWLDEYYKATGKPWNDPRLSVAEKYTSRYEFDAAFRQREKERTRMFKFSHPETVAGWENAPGNRRRWNQAAISADGTVTKGVIKRLSIEKNCAYCHGELTPDSRQIDHVTPLSRGGAHSANNLVACCAPCNMSKGFKKLWQFLPSHCL